MTRLLTCGYETGDLAEAGITTNVSGTWAIATATPSPRSGTYSLKFTPTTNQIGAGTYQRFVLAANKTEVWVRFGINFHITTGTSECGFATWWESAGANQVSLSYHPTDHLIRAYRGAPVTGTLLGTSSASMSDGVWHVLEWRWKVTTTTSTTDGIVEVWLDGTQVINVTADTTNTANLNVLSLLLGNAGAINSVGSSSYLAFDDLAVNDISGSSNNGQIGDGRVYLLKPNGAGSNTSQTRGGTDSGANWSQVDELPPSLTDYVYSATAATRDTYTLEDVPAGTWAVNCVEVLAYGQNSDSGTGSLGLTVKSGSTTNEGTAQNLSTTAAYYRQLYETDPATSTAWTVAAVTALEAGTTVR